MIRADEVDEHGHMEPIDIGAHSNIQDGVVIHSRSNAAVTIGECTSIAHRAIVHGPCTMGDDVLIGFNNALFTCPVAKGCGVRQNVAVDGARTPEPYLPLARSFMTSDVWLNPAGGCVRRVERCLFAYALPCSI